jgi:NAD(P)-dependent dehydrogenase (short-subunit alcohol dehydrogenase family)
VSAQSAKLDIRTGRKAGRSQRPGRAGGYHRRDGRLSCAGHRANKGIGKEIERQLAAAGVTVYAGSRDAARGERAAGEIGGGARLLVPDVTDAAGIAGAAGQVGALDILVNNAGISGDSKTADREDLGTFRRIYKTNVFGRFQRW